MLRSYGLIIGANMAAPAYSMRMHHNSYVCSILPAYCVSIKKKKKKKKKKLKCEERTVGNQRDQEIEFQLFVETC
jgi:hypothetical protein